jgi:transcriptional antiterminator
MSEGKNIERAKVIESPEDLRAIRTVIAYARRVPIPLIQQQMGVSRAQVYRDLKRGREILGIEAAQVIPDLFLQSDDIIREAWAQFNSIDHLTDESGKPLSTATKSARRMAILAQINSFLMTRTQVARLLMVRQTSITAVPTDDGTAIQVRRESKTINELMEGLRREGKIGATNCSSIQS